MSSMPPLLTPAGVQSSGAGAAQPITRAASGVVAKPARGFQVFRIDGYSWTTTLPGGECISSDPFAVGGRNWQVDYYPNGADASRADSAAVAVYLRLQSSSGAYHHAGAYVAAAERVRAQFKFSLLDPAGTAAYELPAQTGVFAPLATPQRHNQMAADQEAAGLGCGGNAVFVPKEELERRRHSLLAEDCLAIRCDVGIMQVETVAVGPKPKGRGRNNYGGGYDDGDDSEPEDGGPRQHQPQDDKEFIRRCLTQRRRA